MIKEFKDKYSTIGERSLRFELVKAGNYVGISANGSSLIVVLDDEQLKYLSDTLNEWIDGKSKA